jgi:peptide deformylase
MVLTIVSVGDPVLRHRARPLTRDEILSAEIQQLIRDMRETMHAAPGVGLAAPQVGRGLQLAVIEDKPEYLAALPAGQVAERARRAVPFHAIINPHIDVTRPKRGGSPVPKAEFFEGCLSLPGFTALVSRALSVRVKCLNERAEPQIIEASGWYARILQHEIDHLEGTVYIDRMSSRSLTTLDNFQRHWKGKTIREVRKELGL